MMQYNPTIMESLCSQLLLRKEEGRQTPTGAGLPTVEQVDQEESKRIPTHPICSRQARRMHFIHQI